MINLKVQNRKDTGRKVSKLRQEGILPGVLYGSDFKSTPVSVDYKEFDKAYQKGGESTILNLALGEDKMNALIYSVQYDSLTGEFQHVDFYKIKKGEKIQVEIDLKFIGAAPAVKTLGGSFISNMDQVEVRCLPKDLIHEVEVDISSLETFEDAIRVKDLPIPKNIEVLEDQEGVVAKVVEAIDEEEILEETEETAAEDVEVVGEEGKEGEAKEEGKKEGEKQGEPKKQEKKDEK